MLDTGSLDRKIAIERNTQALDIDGSVIDTWAQIGRKRWARRYHLDAGERFVSDQFIAREQVGFVVRYAADIADVSPLDRVIYPVTASPADNEIHDIIGVELIGYKEAIRIITARRAET